jgi:hypothetical protein
MSDEKIVISITQAEEGLEIRVNENAYGNVAVIGVLEKIKFALLEEGMEAAKSYEKVSMSTKKKYDA